MLPKKQEMIEGMEASLGIKYHFDAKKLSSEDRLTCIIMELVKHVGHLETLLNKMGQPGEPKQAEARKSGLLLPPRMG